MQKRKNNKYYLFFLLLALVVLVASSSPFVLAEEIDEETAKVCLYFNQEFLDDDFQMFTGLACLECHGFHEAPNEKLSLDVDLPDLLDLDLELKDESNLLEDKFDQEVQGDDKQTDSQKQEQDQGEDEEQEPEKQEQDQDLEEEPELEDDEDADQKQDAGEESDSDSNQE